MEIAANLFYSQQILLSGDVEKNPGPVNHEDKTETRPVQDSKICNTLAALEASLRKEVSSVLSAVQNQTDTLQKLANSLQKLQDDQKDIRDILSKFGEDIAETKQAAQQNSERINDIEARQDETDLSSLTIEDDVDRLESFSRRNNVKFFGIPEKKEAEGEEVCEDTIGGLLKKYAPQKNWSEDTIDRAHRLGRHDPRNPKPRPLIAKFLRWRDVMAIMRDRDIRADMETDGIRVAQDITKRQSAKLRELRSEGKIGYFVNGQLRIKDPPTDRRPPERRQSTSGPKEATRSGDSPASHQSPRPESYASAAAVTHPSSPPHVPASRVSPSVSPRTSAQPRTRSSVASVRQPSLKETWAPRGGSASRSSERSKQSK